MVWKWVDLLAKQNSVSSQAQQVFCSKGPTTELPTAEGHPHREQRRLGITSNYEARSQLSSSANCISSPVCPGHSIRYS